MHRCQVQWLTSQVTKRLHFLDERPSRQIHLNFCATVSLRT